MVCVCVCEFGDRAPTTYKLARCPLIPAKLGE